MKERQKSCRELCGNCYTQTDYIYVNDLGVPYTPNFVTQHFKIVLRKNGLREIRFHDLRHPNVKPKTKSFSTFLRKDYVWVRLKNREDGAKLAN